MVTVPKDQAPVVLSTDKARQAVTGHNVQYVLIFGTVGAIAALVLVYFYFFAA